MMFTNYPEILKVEDIQTALGVGRTWAYRLVKDGIIKSIRVGSKYLIPKKSLIDFVSAYGEYKNDYRKLAEKRR